MSCYAALPSPFGFPSHRNVKSHRTMKASETKALKVWHDKKKYDLDIYHLRWGQMSIADIKN